MKLAVVVDSSCGLTKEEAEKRGWYYLPLLITIDGKEYEDGVDLTPQKFLSIFTSESKTSTSCTPPGVALKLFEELSAKNDFVVVYPISQYLSSQMQNLDVLSKSFKNIFVIKSKNVAQLIVKELVELEKDVLANEITLKQAIKKIETKNRNIPQILLFPENMDALVKGGRLSPSAAKMAKLLKIIPVIGFQDGKLEKYDKGRIFAKTVVNTSVNHFQKLKYNKTFLMLLDMNNPNANNLFNEIKTNLNYDQKAARFQIPSVIAIHTGIGSISVFYTELEKEIDEYNFDKLI